MGDIVYLPTESAVCTAWERYRALVSAAVKEPRLFADRKHMEATVMAEAEWKEAFLTWSRRA